MGPSISVMGIAVSLLSCWYHSPSEPGPFLRDPQWPVQARLRTGQPKPDVRVKRGSQLFPRPGGLGILSHKACGL